MEGVSPIKIDVLKTGPQGSILLDYPVELRKDSLSHQPSFSVSTWNLKIPQCFITQWCSPMFDHPITWLIRYQIITTLGFATWSLKHFFVFCFFWGEKVLREKSFNDGWKMLARLIRRVNSVESIGSMEGNLEISYGDSLINCRAVLIEHHSFLTYIMKGKWSSFCHLGGMFPSKMITYLDYNLLVYITLSPYFLTCSFMVPHFLHEVTMENPLVFFALRPFRFAQLRVICSGPVHPDLHRSRVCIRSRGSSFARSWSTTCVCPRPSDFLGKSGEKSEAMSKNGGIWRYT